MKQIATLVAVLVFLCGCSSKPEPPDTTESELRWLREMTRLENTYTERTYQCMTEMYSLAYRPVNSGPVCRESCKLLEQVNTMAANAPAYIDNPQQYALGESKVCNAPKHSAKAEVKEN